VTAEDFSRALSSVARDLAAEPDEEQTLTRLTGIAVELIDTCVSASVTLLTRRGQHRSVAATDQATIRADLRQYELDEGPCVVAAADQVDVYSGDVAHDDRWPRWGAEAVELGFHSTLAIQLFTSTQVYGALNLYGKERYAFSPDMQELVNALAAHAAIALATQREVDGLNVAVRNRTVIGQAQGIVMERFGLDAQRAFELLTRLASMQERRVTAVAQDIVETRNVPTGSPGKDKPADRS
jgi:GAF domain-containing protein